MNIRVRCSTTFWLVSGYDTLIWPYPFSRDVAGRSSSFIFLDGQSGGANWDEDSLFVLTLIHVRVHSSCCSSEFSTVWSKSVDFLSHFMRVGNRHW